MTFVNIIIEGLVTVKMDCILLLASSTCELKRSEIARIVFADHSSDTTEYPSTLKSISASSDRPSGSGIADL